MPWSTAGTKSKFIRKIKQRDFILLSSDLISDISLDEVIEFHTQRDSLLTAVFVEDEKKASEDDDEIDFVAFNTTTSRLLSVKALEEAKEEKLEFRNSLLANNPQICLNFKVRDCHIYVCKYELLEYLKHTRKTFTDMKEDLIPFLINNQYNRKFQQKMQEYSSEPFPEQLPLQTGVYAFIAQNVHARRVTELNSYLAANQDAFNKEKPSSLRPSVNTEKEIDLVALLSTEGKKAKPQDASIGEGSTIGEKPTFTKSFIGRNCKIGNNVKIAFSVVFPNATIGNNVTIQNSVVGSKATLASKSKIQASFVGHNACVEENSKVTNDFIV